VQVLLVVPAASRADASGIEGARVLVDAQGLVAQRYDARDGSLVLLRPDQHVCARWRGVQRAAVSAALRRALALT
jgi:3-(3-hydroxy-phenyl)propionate hydroxylase